MAVNRCKQNWGNMSTVDQLCSGVMAMTTVMTMAMTMVMTMVMRMVMTMVMTMTISILMIMVLVVGCGMATTGDMLPATKGTRAHAAAHAAAHAPKPTHTNASPSRQANTPRHRSVFVIVVPTSARIFPRGISRRRRLGTLPLCHGPYRGTGASDKPSAAVPLHRVICRSAAHHKLEQHCCGW